MANTYVALAKTVLTVDTASVNFSAIPQTYTDLSLVISSRTNRASQYDTIYMWFNNDDTTSAYSTRILYYDLSAASSTTFNGYPQSVLYNTSAANATASTFGSTEVYLPNYTNASYKVISSTNAAENNSATSWTIGAGAGLFSGTAAISRIDFKPRYGTNFLAGSSFYLYGIKNS